MSSLVQTFLKALRNQAKKLASFFFDRAQKSITFLELDHLQIPVESPKPHFECRPLKEGDLKFVEEAFGFSGAQHFEIKMKVATCYGGFENGVLVGYTWFCHGLCRREGSYPFFYDIEPKNGFLYISGSYMVPGKRNRKLARMIGDFALCEAKKAGYRAVFSTYDVKNIPIRLLASRYGFKVIGQISFRRFFGGIGSDLEDLKKVCQ